MNDDCDLCGLPGIHNQDERCLKEVRRKRKLADEMFGAAISLVHALGDPVKIKDEAIVSKVLTLDLVTWKYAI